MTQKQLLTATGLSKSFAGIKAVNNAQIIVRQGSITGLISPNGAGKTTLFNLICNFIRADRGEVILCQSWCNLLPEQRPNVL